MHRLRSAVHRNKRDESQGGVGQDLSNGVVRSSRLKCAAMRDRGIDLVVRLCDIVQPIAISVVS